MKRKELDDFLKSLGKTMNLVLYRMQVEGRKEEGMENGWIADFLKVELESKGFQEKSVSQAGTDPIPTSILPSPPQDTENLRSKLREERRGGVRERV